MSRPKRVMVLAVIVVAGYSLQFSVSLDRSLVVTMEVETRWMITSNLTNQTTIPDFLDYIYIQGLYSIKPEFVNIIQ